MRYDPFRGYERLETARLEHVEPHAVWLASDAGPIEISSYAPGVLRMRWGPRDSPDYGLLASAADPVAVTCTPGDDRYRIDAGAVSLEIRERPFRVAFLHAGRVVLESASDGHIRGGPRLAPAAVRRGGGTPGSVLAFGLDSGDPVYGLGEKYGPLNRRGQRVVSWNEDAWGVNAEASYKNIPFAWSPTGWGVFVHTPARVVHGVGYPQWSHRAYVLSVEDPSLDVFLLAASAPAGLLERFTYLTGRAPVPPRWSFGAWMSRAYYRTAEEVLDAARMLRERRIPCDVLVLDGRAWLKVDTRFAFEWDADRYPDPPAVIRQLHALGFRLCLWEYPYVSVRHPLFAELARKGYLLRDDTGAACVYEWDAEPFGTHLTPLPASGLIDFTHPDANAWYRDAHRRLFDAGVDVMKTDFGEQVPITVRAHNGDTGARLHNVYPLLFNRCVYEATERYGPGGAVVWGRSGWTGSQRYPVQWGGDPQADWEGLAASIRGGLSWGMSGVPYYSHDVGGFYGPKPDSELYVRWAQAGVMMSHLRFHGTTPREPWHFGGDAERIVRTWLEWRYRLLPYLEACAVEASRTGAPVARAMPLAFPCDAVARGFDEQYMLGPALLVAPVVRPGGRVDVYLPPGTWVDFSAAPLQAEPGTGPHRVIEGGGVVTEVVPLDRIPLYGREGAVLPLGPVAQSTEELSGGAVLSALCVFGLPRLDLAMPGLDLRTGPADAQCRVIEVPEHTSVHACGSVRIERHGSMVECWATR